MSEPAVVIRLPLEGRPQVYADTLHEGEELRLHDWFEAHPDQLELIQLAHGLSERAA